MQISPIQIILNILKQGFSNYKRIGLIILIILFFLSNYHICNYFYPIVDEKSTELWWMMKIDIYALIIALCFWLVNIKPTDVVRINLIEKFITNVGIGLAFSNAIDRHLYGTRGYTKADLVTIIVVVLVSYYDFRKLKKLVKPTE